MPLPRNVGAATALLNPPRVLRVYDPKDRWVISSTTPTIRWTRMEYVSDDLQVASDINFSSLVVDVSGLTDPIYTVPAPLSLGTYYVRVRNRSGNWTYATSFTVSTPFLSRNAASANLRAYFPMDDAIGDGRSNGKYTRVINNAISEGRNILADGDAEAAGTTYYVAQNAAIVSKQGSAYEGSQCLRVLCTGTANGQAAQTNLITGALYHVAGRFRGDGTATAAIVHGSTVAASSASSNTWQQIGGSSAGIYFVAAGGTFALRVVSSTNGQYAEFDSIVLTQVGILPSSAYPTLEMIKNGGFDWDVGWVLNSNWAITGGHAVHTPGSTAVISQAVSSLGSRSYTVTYTVGGSTTGTTRPTIANTNGTTNTGNGPFTETIVGTAPGSVFITPSSGFDGWIDNVSVVPADGLVVFNGDGSSTAGWTAAGAATLSSTGGRLRIAYTGTANAGASQNCLKTGSTYLVSIDMNGDGTAIPSFIINSTLVTGSASTTPVTYTFVATEIVSSTVLVRNTSNSGYVEFDNLTIVEIPPMSGRISGATINQSTGSGTLKAYSFNGVNSFVNLLSGVLNSVYPVDTGAISFVMQTTSWGSGLTSRAVSLTSDNNNRRLFDKNSTGNLLVASDIRNAVTKQMFPQLTASSEIHVVMTYNGVAVCLFIDGEKVSELASPGAWIGNLTTALIGASNTSANSPFSGQISHLLIEDAVPSDAEILARAQLSKAA